MSYNFNETGIDKLILKSLDPTIIDINKLILRKNVKITKNGYFRTYLIDNIPTEIGDIEIRDSIFFLRMGMKKIGKKMIEFEKLELNPSIIIHGNNINNINKSTDLLLAIDILKNRLSFYGIDIDIQSCMIKEIELNKNIILNHSFNEYKQCFDLITETLPLRFKNKSSYFNNEIKEYTGFKSENEQLSLKFYNKSLEQNLFLPYNILRVEYKFKNPKKVKQALKYNSFSDLSYNLNNIDTVFNSLIEKDIVIPIKNKIKQLLHYNSTSLIRLKENKRYYIQQFCAETQDDTIFD